MLPLISSHAGCICIYAYVHTHIYTNTKGVNLRFPLDIQYNFVSRQMIQYAMITLNLLGFNLN